LVEGHLWSVAVLQVAANQILILTCENCHKRYSIADDRISGAKVKIRCRGCGHVTRCQPLASEPRRRSSAAGWFVVVDGKQVGPLSKEKLRGHFANQPANQDALVWRRGMPKWKRARELPELARLLPVQSARPKLDAELKRVETAQATRVRTGEPEEVEPADVSHDPSWFSIRNLTSRAVVIAGLLVGLSAILFWGMFGTRSPVVPERARGEVEASKRATKPSTQKTSPMANLLLGQKREPLPRPLSVGHRTPAVTIARAETPAETNQPPSELDPQSGVHSEIGSRVPKRLADSARDVAEAGLGEKEVARVVAQSQPAFQFCIEQELRKNPTFRGGKVFVTAAVGSSGIVKSVEISRRDIEQSPLGDCLKSKAKRMVFPPFRGDETEVQVPLILTTNLP